MLSSRFMSVPLHPCSPSNNNTSSLQCETTNEGSNKGIIRVSGEGSAGVKNTLCFFMYSGCIVVVVSFLAAVERCWCSRGCRNVTHSKTAELDRQVHKVITGEGRGYGKNNVRLFPTARYVAPPVAPFSCTFSNSASLYPKFKRSTLESSLLLL